MTTPKTAPAAIVRDLPHRRAGMGTGDPSQPLLARHTVYNLAGLTVPLLAAVVAVPPLVRGLGTERFGVLSLVFTMIGYVAVFDLGLSRATTRFVAQDASGDHTAEIFWTSLWMLLGLGVAAALAVVAATPWVVGHLLRVPAALQEEVRGTFYVAALSLPFVFAGGAPRGLLEAYHRFDVVNAIRLPSNVLLFLGPLALLPFTRSLPPIAVILAVNRVIVFAISTDYCLRVIPRLRQARPLDAGRVARMVRFGGWVTLTTMFGSPIANGYVDRLAIAAVLGVGAVTPYAIPFEVISKISLLPAAIVAVLFPVFSRESPAHTMRLERASMAVLAGILIPLTVLVSVFAQPLLTRWVGADLAAQSAVVVRLLMLGAVANAVAYVPFTSLQGFGRADLTAKRHIVQLPLYVALAVWLVRAFGVAGAAAAWTLWAGSDAIVLVLLRRRLDGRLGRRAP